MAGFHGTLSGTRASAGRRWGRATHPMLVPSGMHVGIMGIAIASFCAAGYDTMFLRA